MQINIQIWLIQRLIIFHDIKKRQFVKKVIISGMSGELLYESECCQNFDQGIPTKKIYIIFKNVSWTFFLSMHKKYSLYFAIFFFSHYISLSTLLHNRKLVKKFVYQDPMLGAIRYL